MNAEYPNTKRFLESLNGLYTVDGCWRLARANKEHIDGFGYKIRRGEHYYVSGQFGTNSYVALNKQSMEYYVTVLFHHNDNLFYQYKDLAEANHKKHTEFLRGGAALLEQSS